MKKFIIMLLCVSFLSLPCYAEREPSLPDFVNAHVAMIFHTNMAVWGLSTGTPYSVFTGTVFGIKVIKSAYKWWF